MGSVREQRIGSFDFVFVRDGDGDDGDLVGLFFPLDGDGDLELFALLFEGLFDELLEGLLDELFDELLGSIHFLALSILRLMSCFISSLKRCRYKEDEKKCIRCGQQ